MLLASLGGAFWIQSRDNLNSFAKLMLTGFFFAWIGDTLLIFEPKHPVFFMLGLGAFLITHILYIVAFTKKGTVNSNIAQLKKKPYLILIFAMLGLGLYTMFYPNLADLAIPVAIYTAVIIIMVLAAINRNSITNSDSYKLCLIGALLFMLSDMTLAVNKFFMPIDYAGLYLIVLYMAGQYLIMRGSILHLAND
tara:strand:- start:27 stop:608 length:582 start_codon:yes stop_codon:yes gene_type:complete